MPINTAPHIHNLVLCANIFVRKDEKYLLIKRSPLKRYAPGVFSAVGGKIDANENPFLGGRRELIEEAGISVKNMRLEAVILEIRPIKNENYNWLVFHFTADYDSGELKTTEEGELMWLTKEETLAQKFFPSVQAVVPHILNPNDGTVFATFEYDSDGKIIEGKSRTDLCTVA